VYAHSKRRGMTLIELMVAMGVASLVMVGITNAFIAQTRQYQSLAGRRDSQSSARMGLTMIEDKLRLAGYGVDPNLAITAYDSWDAETTDLAGDTKRPDAIVIHQRDPSFQRTIESAMAGSIQFSVPLNPPGLMPGQILLALCSGARTYTYVTVKDQAKPNEKTVSLLTAPQDIASPVGFPESRFRGLSPTIDDPCFDTGDARLVKVDRYAFFVAAFDEDRNAATPKLPFLMMHRGLDVSGPAGVPDNVVDINDAVPIAPGVEQLQIAYVMNTRPADPVVVLGVDPTGNDRVPPPDDVAAAALGMTAWDLDATRPRWGDSYLHANRFTSNPANIRQVRVTLVSRSKSRNEAVQGDKMYSSVDTAWSLGTLTGGTTVWRQLENLGDPAGTYFDPNSAGYLRSVTRIAVSPKNLFMRAQFLPPNSGG
jgi:type IV pilus assembly protein PilW